MLLPIIVMLLSCKKDDDILSSASIYGKWQLEWSCGGIAGCQTATKDQITTIEFTEKEVIEQVIVPGNASLNHYEKSSYTIINTDVLDEKVVYELTKENGTTYQVEVYKGYLLLEPHPFLRMRYNKR